MDLKQKYDQHKTTFNEQAWDSFSDMRNTSSIDKSKLKKYNMKNTTLLLCLLFGFASLALFFSLNYNKWSKVDVNKISSNKQNFEKNPEKMPLKNETYIANEVANQKVIDKNIQNQENLTKADFSTTLKTQLSTKTNEPTESKGFIEDLDLTVNDSKSNIISILIDNKPSIKTQQLTNTKFSQSKMDFLSITKSSVSPTSTLSFKNNLPLKLVDLINTNSTKPNIQDMVLKPIKKPQSMDSRTTNEISVVNSKELTSKASQLNTEDQDISKKFVYPLDIIFTKLNNNNTLEVLHAVPGKPEIYKNTFSLGINIAPWSYVNGSIPYGNEFREVIKRGYFIDLDYRRRLNKILSIGAGLGYAHAKDVNNPELDTLDFETNIHAHARIYFFLLNKEKNRAFVKIGGGFSHSERLHSGISALGPEEYERRLQWRKYNAFGITVEASYEHNITKQLFAGFNLGVSTGNEGFTYAGLSLGYSFKQK